MGYLWAGRILTVNLTEGQVNVEPSAPYMDRFLGGKAVNAKLLFHKTRAGTGPLDPDNALLFGAGPLVGTSCPAACRTDVMSRSPVSGGLGNADMGGYWGPELKFAGYDHLVIEGRAERPVYLYVRDDQVQIRDASAIWGQDTYTGPALIRREIGDERVQVACIGPAGERLVVYASIRSGTGNSASRTGLGAVMGSKNLKAVAVRGTGGLGIARPAQYLAACRELFASIQQGRLYGDLHEAGITRIHDREMRDAYRLLGTTWDQGETISETRFLEEHLFGRVGCFACPVACFDSYNMEGQAGSGAVKCSPYGDLTWDVRNADMMVFWNAFVQCQRYGLDVRSLSNALAWLMELHARGIITAKDTDGIPMEWGSAEAIVTMARKMSLRQGVGDLLADGLPAAARKIGRGAEDYLLMAKGSPSDMHIPPVKTMGLAAAISPVGEDASIQPRMGYASTRVYLDAKDADSFAQAIRKHEDRAEREVGTRKAADPRSTEGKAALVRREEERADGADITGVCSWMTPFMGFPVTAGVLARLMTLGTGVAVTAEQILDASVRMRHVIRAMEAKLGRTRDDDRVSRLYYSGRFRPGGRSMPEVGFTEAELEAMKDDYYRLMEWDPRTGMPGRKVLDKWALGDLVP